MANSYLKIKNISGKPVNFVLPLANSGSKGILLNADESVVSESFYTKGALLITAPLSIQKRRGLVEIEENFNNDLYKFPINQNLVSTSVEEKINLANAQKNAENYMKS